MNMELGFVYYYGLKGVKIDYEKSFEQFQLIKPYTYNKVSQTLAKMHLEGIGTP